MGNKRNYWGYRIDTTRIDYFKSELSNGILRQGWGYDKGQDLRNMTYDGGASKNLGMLKVKKGDYLLIPRLPDWNSVAIVEAKEDWNDSYEFQIGKLGDYGHKFPAKLITSFNRRSKLVSGNIKSTLQNPKRFWKIRGMDDEINKIVDSKDNIELRKYESEKDGLYGSIEAIYNKNFNKDNFKADLQNELRTRFQGTEWENVLVAGLSELYPGPLFSVERVGGKSEKKHGTDVLIKFFEPLSNKYFVIAIQIKDYKGIVSNNVVYQINKANWWNKYSNSKGEYELMQKILIVTNAEKSDNEKLQEECKRNDIRLIMGKELDEIIMQIGLNRIAKIFSTLEK